MSLESKLLTFSGLVVLALLLGSFAAIAIPGCRDRIDPMDCDRVCGGKVFSYTPKVCLCAVSTPDAGLPAEK